MYYPIGWPKSVNLLLPGENDVIQHISFDAVKILLAAIGRNFLGIWYANPLVPIVFNRRNADSIASYGTNKWIVWRPDSKQLVILTTGGVLLLYQVEFVGNGVFTQLDSSSANLQRESAELFIKENIPKLRIKKICIIQLCFTVTTLCCINLTELLVATDKCELIRIQWSQLENDEFIRKSTPLPQSISLPSPSTSASSSPTASPSDVIQLRSIQFYVSQHCNLNCVRPIGSKAYIVALEYSPFVGGYAVVFSDNRAAFLLANHLRFETRNMHGFWIPEVEDATVCGINHKFRLLAFGRQNSEVAVYAIEDTTGGLEFSHRLSLNSFVAPGTLSAVNELKWSPDGCVLIVAWQNGGFALWSTFGTLLMSSLCWDYRLHMDLVNDNPLRVSKLEWSTEGYQLYMTCQSKQPNSEHHPNESDVNVLQYSFVKSALTMNPCMTSYPHILLQDDQCLYLNQGNTLEKVYFGGKVAFPYSRSDSNLTSETNGEECLEIKDLSNVSSAVMETKYWTVLHLPQTYVATNWPIRYAAVDYDGVYLAVAGRTGLAHYCMTTKKWKLFGNESQEKDFVVSGGLLWWKGFIVAGCYSLLEQVDEIRCYPEESKLDNQYLSKITLRAPVISLNIFREQLIVLTADGIVSLFVLKKVDACRIEATCAYEVDVKSICIHPACIVSLTVTNLRNDLTSKNPSSSNNSEVSVTIILNVCGRILMIQKDNTNTVLNNLMATCLASCVECFWLSNSTDEGSIMRDCLWLFSGIHGMRVWLPILPPVNEQVQDASHRLHTFMSKRIMLSFPLKLYPLVILFDNVMVLGVENETTLYTNEANSYFTLPFSQLERISQVYLHKILRQLIKRNLGYSAWEIAQSCRRLPYFPHSLELLLHEVLEEEATSKEPIPDALLPRVLDFIREFPVYYQTIVQCARKTEIALWPHLFSIAGKPKDLFCQCLESEELVTAASYLVILQNLETSTISKEYATLLLEVALQHCQWDLAKDIIRFFKAIDPNEMDSPRSSMVVNMKIAPPSQSQSQVASNNPDVFNLVLGPIARDRSFSTTVLANATSKDKKDKISNPTVLLSNHTNSSIFRRKTERSNSTKERREAFCIENILQRNARKLLQNYKLIDLGYMSAHLDFHLVAWLSNESEKITCFEDYVAALSALHEELKLPSPIAMHLYADDSDLDYNHEQQKILLMEKQNHQPPTFSQSGQSESGYFSLALAMDTPTSTNNGNNNNLYISSIKENEELNYISTAVPYRQQFRNADLTKSLSNSQMSLDSSIANGFYSSHEIISPLSYTLNLSSNTEMQSNKVLSEKLAIKLRYLLQLFIEANCIDLALVLSILLQDAASIGRIINVVIRSEPISVARRIQESLRTMSQWAFDNECIYRTFVISLQPHLQLLQQYLQSSSANPPTASHNTFINNTHTSDKADQHQHQRQQHLKASALLDSPNDNLNFGLLPGTQLNGKLHVDWPSYDKYPTVNKYSLNRTLHSKDYHSSSNVHTQHLPTTSEANDHNNYKNCMLM